MAIKNGYVTEDTEDKLYNVRDKDYGDGKPVIVWGQNLPHEAAHLLKERIVGRGKSTTARLVENTHPLPATAVDPKGNPIEDVNELAHALTHKPVPARPSSVVTANKLHADPQLASVQRAAMAAAKVPATAAQQRAAMVSIPQHAHNQAAEAEQPVEQVPEIDLPPGIESELDEMGDDAAVVD